MDGHAEWFALTRCRLKTGECRTPGAATTLSECCAATTLTGLPPAHPCPQASKFCTLVGPRPAFSSLPLHLSADELLATDAQLDFSSLQAGGLAQGWRKGERKIVDGMGLERAMQMAVPRSSVSSVWRQVQGGDMG